MSESVAATATDTEYKMSIWNDPELSSWEKAHKIKELSDKQSAITGDEELSDWEKVHKLNELRDEKKTEEAKAKTNEPESAEYGPKTFEQVARAAFGNKIIDELSSDANLMKRLEKSDKLRDLIVSTADKMPGGKSVGSLFDEDDDFREKMLVVLRLGISPAARPQEQVTQTPNDEADEGEEDDIAPTEAAGLQANGIAYVLSRSEKKRAKREKKRNDYVAKLRGQGLSEEEINDKLEKYDRKERRWKYVRRIGLGAAALAGAGTAYYFAFKYGGGHNSTGLKMNPPQNPAPGAGSQNLDQLHTTFNMVDTSTLTDKLHHANDFGPGIPASATGDIHATSQQINDMLRGNPNITAMYAAQLGIPGAPNFDPSALQHSDAAVSAFNVKVNEYGHYLQSNPQARLDVTNQITAKLNGFRVGDEVTLRSGYMSPGANNTLNQFIYGSKPMGQSGPHEVFIDPSVGYSDQKARELIAPDGTIYYLDEYCGQLSFQQAVPQAVPSYVPQSAPQNFVPEQPPVQPPAPQPEIPVDVPDIPAPQPPDYVQYPDYGYPPEQSSMSWYPRHPHHYTPTPPPPPSHPLTGKNAPGGNQYDAPNLGPGRDEGNTPAPVVPEVTAPPRTNTGNTPAAIVDSSRTPSTAGAGGNLNRPTGGLAGAPGIRTPSSSAPALSVVSGGHNAAPTRRH